MKIAKSATKKPASARNSSGRALASNLALPKPKLDKRAKRRLVRRSIITGNILLVALVAVFILVNHSASQTIRTNNLNNATTAASSIINPVDQLSSSQIALTAAQMANLPELTAIRNQADSDSLLLNIVPNDSTTLAKPQIVATAEKSRADIVHYTTVAGDTITSLSAKFNVTPASIRWSNNIYGDALTAGTHIVIPPVNGIVYTVKSGDTPASLAARFQTDASTIINYNDAEISGLTPGEQILIPNGQIAPAVTISHLSFTASYGGNGYDFGYCTWYVANRVAVPTNWGNANTWALYAQLSGWTVSSTPIPGAIAQTSRGYEGHVAYVEAVSPDGSQIKYSDMNGLAGWGRIGYSEWAPASTFEHYIYH